MSTLRQLKIKLLEGRILHNRTQPHVLIVDGYLREQPITGLALPVVPFVLSIFFVMLRRFFRPSISFRWSYHVCRRCGGCHI